MITVSEKIKTTEEEFNSVNQNERLSLSEELRHRETRSQARRAEYKPDTKTFEEYMEKYHD